MRGRNRNNKGPNPLTRSYESNGPDVKIRGTAQHVAEKYSQLARDSHASGDPVAAENYYQHAEHYFRIIATAQEQLREQYGYQPRPFDEEGEEEGGFPGDRGYADDADFGNQPQPLTRSGSAAAPRSGAAAPPRSGAAAALRPRRPAGARRPWRPSGTWRPPGTRRPSGTRRSAGPRRPPGPARALPARPRPAAGVPAASDRRTEARRTEAGPAAAGLPA